LGKVPVAFSFPSETHDQATLASKRKGFLSISERSNQKAFVASCFTAADEEIVSELQALFTRHNAGTALSAKAVFKPTRKFHAATGGV
jgi:hypothetical protein